MAKKIDSPLLIVIIVLSVLGLINFFSASYYYSLVNFNNPYFYFFRFLTKITLAGFLFFLIGYFLGKNLLRYKKIFIFLFLIIYFSIFLGFLPQFKLKEGISRWVNLGFISFQPSELIKPLAILFFIFLMAGIKKFSLLQKNLIFIIFSAFLLIPIFLQPSLSNVLIIMASIGTVFFNSLKSKKEILMSLLIFIIVFLILILISTRWEYRKERLMSFLTKGQFFKERYFQVEQATIAVSSGGLWGKGLGKSEIKILGLPQMLTDSIFAIFAEEWGFIGSIFLLSLFFFLIFRIIFLGKKSKSVEKQSFSFALAAWIFLQTFLHISSNIGLFIPTGVVLPFFSYGASGQLAIYFSLGIISSYN